MKRRRKLGWRKIMVGRLTNVLPTALAAAVLLLLAAPCRAGKTAGGYVVVVSEATYAKADWRKVADALR